MQAPQIYRFDNYRLYLEAAFKHRQAQQPEFSYRQFARESGYQTPNHFQRVVQGHRNLTLKGIERFLTVFRLEGRERLFFKKLVQFNQAKTNEKKAWHLKELLRFKEFKENNPLMEEHYRYLSKWYYVVIREMILLPDFEDDPKWIASRLKPNVSIPEVLEALMTLQKLGFIERNKEGQLKVLDRKIDTGREVMSTTIINYHQEMIRMGRESIERFQREMRDISAVTFPLDRALLPIVKDMINRFRSELVSFTSQAANPTDIFNLNLQLFPFSDTNGKQT